MSKDSHGLDADDLAAADEWVELGALLQLVPDALAAGTLVYPRANFVLLQPVATVLGLDAFVDDGTLVQETSASVAAFCDVTAIAFAHPAG